MDTGTDPGTSAGTDTSPAPGDRAWTGFLGYLRERHGLDRLTEIGRGGMGRVYRAWDGDLDRWVAVKVLASFAATPSSLNRFRQESRILGQLRHPAVVGVHSATTSPDGVAYFIMDHVPGEDLGTRIARRRQAQRPFTVAEVVDLLTPVADALDTIHRMQPQVIHRDVKPANILVPDQPSLWPAGVLTDFGISLTQDATRVTSEGILVGTDSYLAPELFREVTGEGPVAGASVDLYALSLIVFEMLSLRSMRELTGKDAWYYARRYPGLPSTALAVRDRPRAAAVGAVLERALADRPDDRYPTATAMLGALSASVGAVAGAGGSSGAAPVPSDRPETVHPETVHPETLPHPVGRRVGVPVQGPSRDVEPGRLRRGHRRGRTAAVLLVVAVLVPAVAYPVSGLVRYPAWSGSAQGVASAFPGIIPDRQNRKGWSGLSCAEASPGPGELGRILCSGPSRNLVVADFGSAGDREKYGSAADLTTLLSGDCAIRTGAVDQGSGAARVVLPQQEGKDRYSLLLASATAESDIRNIPVC
ncbi:Serine/threonine-protein kinase PknA [Corynebacterium provencense]|uniref:non-specific serine/threonine protein kinase n=1 Tax=Corynebacterium provencense TaxID=1737425 RepID=A0A2Z3YLY8_9CORY|nr:serine/threonine-protein kinase [Corynebacterium provencense]AWT25545.1 Serine/threonine-protein kinase PknA [Corynebacterium provencense]